jgi:dipeptidase D
MSLLKKSIYKEIYEDSRLPEPKSVWNYFLALMETPRGSGHYDYIVPKLIEIGNSLGLKTIKDKVGNILIQKPASSGCENWPGVCLQAHYGLFGSNSILIIRI